MRNSINTIPSKDNDGKSLIHSRSDNIELMINCKEDEIMEELFQSLSLRCQIGLETSMKGSDFISNCHNMLQ